MTLNYSEIYKYNYFKKCDGMISWDSQKLKFGDAFAAICYAHGIYWEQIQKSFPQIGALGKVETTPYTIQDQINFIQSNKTRTPKKILEIGGGRGEVTIFLANLGYDVVGIEPGKGAEIWFKQTSKLFFSKKLQYTLLNGCLTEYINHPFMEDFDTVLFVESLEHILEEDFNKFYPKILKTLKKNKGTFVVTNWMDYHPLPVGWMAPPDQHCRLINDDLYDEMKQQFDVCNYRNGSHLCLSFS